MKPYRANFLWPHSNGSIEEAGYEFANGATKEYQKQWWRILILRIENEHGERTAKRIAAALKTIGKWKETK